MMRRFAAILLSTLLSLTFLPAFLPADCQCPTATPKELMDHATYVFNADVWDVEVDAKTKRRTITFDANETFKGQFKDGRLEVRDAEEGTSCVTDFHEGEQYLVYVHWQWGAMLTSRCWGTKRLQEAQADSSQLGVSAESKAKYYDKLRIYCMGRRDTACCLQSLKEMRAGGFLPQPDAGCPDEMIPDRLRCDGSYVWCAPTVGSSRHNR